MLSLSCKASSSLFKTRTPTASPRQYPSASSRNVLQPPVGDRKPPPLRAECQKGVAMMFEPPAIAVSQSRFISALNASPTAVAAEPQAESTQVVAPSHLK